MCSHLHVVLSHTLPTTLISVESSGACKQSCLPQTSHKKATSYSTIPSYCLHTGCPPKYMCGIIPHTVRLIALGKYNPNDFSHQKMYCHMYILGWTSGCEGRGKTGFHDNHCTLPMNIIASACTHWWGAIQGVYNWCGATHSSASGQRWALCTTSFLSM